jgi:gamma-butyrobetaine dioxygenase
MPIPNPAWLRSAVPSEPTVRSAQANGDVLHVEFHDGPTPTFLAAALREISPDPATTHPITRERLISLSDLPANITFAWVGVEPDGDGIDIHFSDGHVARYSAGLLRSIDQGDDSVSRVTWDACQGAELPTHAWDRVSADRGAESLWLAAVQTYGFALLRGTPPEPNFLESLAGRIGPIRESNFGRIFDVKTTVAPTSNAYTTAALGPHTDLATREHPPGLQYLHCIANAAEGGDSLLVDGCKLCDRLAADEPEAWRLLTTLAIPCANKANDCDYRWRGPLITRNARGELDTLRFTMWLRAPLVGPIDEVRATYRALRAIVRLAEDPSLVFRFRLAPGDILLIDNRRVLHGRTAFLPTTGERWLRGCYGEREDIASRRRVLARPS